MNRPEIDWNAVWRDIHARKQTPARDPAFWDKRAAEFARHVRRSDYIDQFISIMSPQPAWRVLDVGSGAGTLAVPLAACVRHITAMDPSRRMRELLDARCREHAIENIRIIDGRWEDDWRRLGIAEHDIVVASRSLMVEDIGDAVGKLQRFATRRVYISTLVDDGPHDRNIVEAVGREFHAGADYIVLVNILRRMGIFANLAFTVNRDRKTFSDLADAVGAMRWMIHEMTRTEEERLRAYLARVLVRGNGGWTLPYQRVVRWAVLWWDKE